MSFLMRCLFGLVFVFLVGCKDTSPAKVTKRAPAPAITEEDKASVMELGVEIEKRLLEGDLDYFLDTFDLEELIFESFEEVDLSNDFKQGMSLGLQQARESMAASLAISQIDFVGYEEVRGYPGLLFRVRTDGGMDYVRYELRKSSEHLAGWKIVDSFPLTLGVFVSDLLRANILPALKDANRSVFDKLFSNNQKEKVDFEYFGILMKAIRSSAMPGQEENALRLYDSVPEEARQSRIARLARVFVCSNYLEDEEGMNRYGEALEDFAKNHPEDPSLSLWLIDTHILSGDFESAHASVSDLQKAIPDRYLEFYKGFINLHEEKYEEAERRAEVFIQSDPDDVEGYELLLEVGFGKNEHALTARALRVLEGDFQNDYSGVFELPEWEDFRTSEEGKKWAEERRGE